MKNRESIKTKVLEILESQDKVYKSKELARHVGISPKDYTKFRNLLRDMASADTIVKSKSNRYGAAKASSILSGRLHVKVHGYGFLITPEDKDDVFISLKNMGIALDGDLVKVQLFAQSKRRRPEGRVIEVLERKRNYIVGTIKEGKHYHFLSPDDLKITRDIYIPKNDLNGAKPGQKAAVEIDYWEDEYLNPEGHVSKILGNPGDPGVDVLSIVASHNLPLDFSDELVSAAKKKSGRLTKKVLAGREDLRDLVCFTIDPADAKDYDDAVSIRELEDGNFEVGVHIADVSHFVQEGDEVDLEALERGTSVYLVDRVLPMLPERLSNELCSLKPNKDRLTFSCMMQVTPAGDVAGYRIVESVIHSKKRFTYEEAQEFLDGKTEIDAELGEPLQKLDTLAKALRKKRIAAGSLDFDLPEPKIILNRKGIPTDIQRRQVLGTMQLVEEFMLLANQTVAKHIDTMKDGVDAPAFLFRVHEPPNPEKLANFSEFINSLGLPIRSKGEIGNQKLSKYIRSIKGREEEQVIKSVMLRSLMKAKYDTENLGHFGLAFKHYTHFTSPIRRYPDLIVHRMLKLYQQKNWAKLDQEKLVAKLDHICERASEREVMALDAERTSVKMKQVQFMVDKIDLEYDGIITGVVHFGLFVELADFLVEGLIHISDLKDDSYSFDEKNYSLSGSDEDDVFHLGDRVRVKVVRVDVDERIIDLILTKKYEKKKQKMPVATQDIKKSKKSDGQKEKTTPKDAGSGSDTGNEQQPLLERSTVKRQLTRGDIDSNFFTTLRSRKPQKSRRGPVNNQAPGKPKPSGRKKGKGGGKPARGKK